MGGWGIAERKGEVAVVSHWEGAEGLILRAGDRQGTGRGRAGDRLVVSGGEQRESDTASRLGSLSVSPGAISLSRSLSKGCICTGTW